MMIFWAMSIDCWLQKCPFDAIMIINLPKNLEKETTHRYGPNSFKLHRWWLAASPVGSNRHAMIVIYHNLGEAILRIAIAAIGSALSHVQA